MYQYPYQQEFLKECRENSINSAIWHRQSGKTTTLIESVRGESIDNNYILFLIPKHQLAKDYLDKIINQLKLNSRDDNYILDNIGKKLKVSTNLLGIRGCRNVIVVIDEFEYIDSNIIDEVISLYKMGIIVKINALSSLKTGDYRDSYCDKLLELKMIVSQYRKTDDYSSKKAFSYGDNEYMNKKFLILCN